MDRRTLPQMGCCNSLGFIGIQQLVAPPPRGCIVTVYLTMYSLFGLGMGSYFIGLMSQFLFAPPRGLGNAIALSALVTTLLGASMMLLTRRSIAARKP